MRTVDNSCPDSMAISSYILDVNWLDWVGSVPEDNIGVFLNSQAMLLTRDLLQKAVSISFSPIESGSFLFHFPIK